MISRSKVIETLRSLPWLADLIALIGVLGYTLLSWQYAHTRQSILDEGAYLLKGTLFVSGQYRIYQDYGPWSNHMPLAFYIPGVVQLIFGAGLRTGRYFALIMSFLMLLGVWVLVRRLAGKWWAAVAVMAVALNPAVTKMYSVYVSQGLIACMLVWTLVLTLGEKRHAWQISLAALIASAIVMTRINMLPLIPLLVLYVFWQHGMQKGMLASGFSLAGLAIGHALFWPGILRMWAYWLPEAIAPFLATWRPPSDAVLSWDPDIDLTGRIVSFFSSFRVNFTAMLGTLAAWILWPQRAAWRKASDWRAGIFLSTLFASLYLLHVWATLGKNYCVYCLAGYVTFFSAAGLVLVALSFLGWRRNLPAWTQTGILILVILLSAGLGLSAFENYGAQLYKLQIPALLARFIPNPGSDQIGPWLRNAYALEPGAIRQLLPTVAGAGVGLLIALAALGLYLVASIWLKSKASYGYWLLLVFFILGTLFTPNQALAGGYGVYECSGDVIASYEELGAYLQQQIPAGSKVYWKGGLSAVPLLYIPQVQIYPAQINGDYSFRDSGDPQELARYGFWSKEMALKWLSEADFILIQERYFSGWLADAVIEDQYIELQASPPTVACMDKSQIRIFRRKP